MLDSLNSILLAAEKGIKYETAQQVLMAFVILMTIAAVAIIVVIMMQKGTNDNVGVITGASDTFYGKNKRAIEKAFSKSDFRSLHFHSRMRNHLLRDVEVCRYKSLIFKENIATARI